MSRDLFQKCREYSDSTVARAQGFYPYFRCIEQSYGNHVVCEGKEKIMIGSNNYLGLAQDPRVVEAACEATRKFGAGCTGSRLLNGTISLHNDLEEALADFLQREAVILFSTGFFANQGALAALTEGDDFILCDKENHASIIEGCQVAPAKLIPYRHNSAEVLRNRLKRLPAEAGKLVIMDGVFSMSGDIADLPPMIKAAREFGAALYVDEAHSLGVVGPEGRGIVHHFGANDEVDIVMGTFSKSLGSMGGFIAGSAEMVEFLKHKARCMIFTASLAPAVVGGVLKALEIMRAEPERIDQLWKNTRKMHEGFKQIGFKIGTTQTPIVPILIGSEAKAFAFSQRLYDEGVFATPAIYPAVRYGEAIVRTSFMSSHTEDDLDKVLQIFAKIAKELGTFDDPAYTEPGRRKNVFDFNLPESGGFEALRGDTGVAARNGSGLHATVSR
ncbi:MAG: aminotransferase class I/II-fold pyridoxal phosphate-dependent enzyme [Proteobacteria bacterium]|jgi:8-amino-7-oxononanoate synthase|nr:aminotransferase class I/II-fold pyridoxal phosphate-dependent enzyme [Pseudomonadota bacterium]